MIKPINRPISGLSPFPQQILNPFPQRILSRWSHFCLHFRPRLGLHRRRFARLFCVCRFAQYGGCLLLCCSCLLLSCGSLRQSLKQKSNTQQSSRTAQKTATQSVRTERTQRLQRDSTTEKISVQITPNGYFQYSESEGFKGTASALNLVRRIKKSQLLTEQKQLDSLYRQTTQQTQHQTQKEKQLTRQVFSRHWRSGAFIALIFVLLALGYGWWKRGRQPS